MVERLLHYRTAATLPFIKPVDEDLQYWLRLADSDIISAEALHRVGQELHCLFFLQQAVEKTLKVLLLKQTAAAPPRIHNLRKLAERGSLVLTAEQGLLLENLSRFYLEARYPGDWAEPPPEASSAEAERLIPAAKGFIQWLRSQI